MFLLLYLTSILLLFTSVSSQVGTECVTTGDCFDHQYCNFGYCSCEAGYIKNIHHCFPLKGYGKVCWFGEQCEDFRLVCATRAGDSPEIKRCICGGYHEWNSEIEQCVPVKNFKEMIQNLSEVTNWAEEISSSNKQIFYRQVTAGIVAITIGMFLTLFCVIYGCCFRGRKPADGLIPKEKTDNIRIQEVASAGPSGGTYMVIPTDLSLVAL